MTILMTFSCNICYWQNMYNGKLSAEFRSEIQTLSKVEHLNLVNFFGYLEYEDEHLILVEYVSNGTLRQHLDGRSNVCSKHRKLFLYCCFL
jgi:serine/threonine protein kinase